MHRSAEQHWAWQLSVLIHFKNKPKPQRPFPDRAFGDAKYPFHLRLLMLLYQYNAQITRW